MFAALFVCLLCAFSVDTPVPSAVPYLSVLEYSSLDGPPPRTLTSILRSGQITQTVPQFIGLSIYYMFYSLGTVLCAGVVCRQSCCLWTPAFLWPGSTQITPSLLARQSLRLYQICLFWSSYFKAVPRLGQGHMFYLCQSYCILLYLFITHLLTYLFCRLTLSTNSASRITFPKNSLSVRPVPPKSD